MNVTHDAHGCIFSVKEDDGVAELHYRMRDRVMELNHTFTPPELRGRGLAGHLMIAALEYARSEGLGIAPLCSYAEGYMKRHPEHADLLRSSQADSNF